MRQTTGASLLAHTSDGVSPSHLQLCTLYDVQCGTFESLKGSGYLTVTVSDGRGLRGLGGLPKLMVVCSTLTSFCQTKP